MTWNHLVCVASSVSIRTKDGGTNIKLKLQLCCLVYGVYASQLIHYARCCSNCSDFLSCDKTSVAGLQS